MARSKTPKNELFPLRHKEVSSQGIGRYCGVPTPADICKTKLFGIPLASQLTGEQFSEEGIQFYINAAMSEIEHILDLNITPVTYREKHDYRSDSFVWSFAYLKLDHPNILTVNKVELSFSNSEDTDGFVQFPLEHVHVQPQEGVIQLVPAFGTSLSGFLLSAFSGTQYHALRAIGASEFPGGIRVEYTAGFEENKIPYIICQLIEIKAAINILSAIGPVLFPNNSTSIGIDGVSQSVSGPGPGFLQQRLQQLQQEEEKVTAAVKSYYQRTWLIDFF